MICGMPEPLESFVYSDFSGGLNTNDGPFELDDNEAQDLLNVSLTQRGALEKRAGKTRFDTSGMPGGVVVGAEHLRSWYPGASKFLMASIDGKLYSFDAAGACTLRVTGTSPAVWSMEQMQNAAGAEMLWAVNGVDQPRKITPGFVVANWGAGSPAITSSIIRVWKNRMVVSAGAYGVAPLTMRVDFSKIGDPETFGANDFQIIKGSEEDVEPITWLEVLGDNLIVFKKNSVWSIYAEPPNIALKRLGEPGCQDRFQTCVVGDRVYWWSRNGVWSTDGVEAPVYESKAIENFILENHNFALASKVRLCSSRDRRVFVALAIDSSSIGNNQMLELVTDLQDDSGNSVQGPWLRHDLPAASMCSFRPVETDVLMAGAADAAKVHTLFSGASDDGVAIRSFWWSSWQALYGEEPIERLRRLNFQMDGMARVDVYRDFEDIPAFTATLTRPGAGGDTLWDGGLWDGGLWTSSVGQAGFLRARPETRGRYHSVKVSNDDLVIGMKILSIEMMVRGGTKELHT